MLHGEKNRRGKCRPYDFGVSGQVHGVDSIRNGTRSVKVDLRRGVGFGAMDGREREGVVDDES